MPDWVHLVTVPLLHYYKTLTLPSKEVKKLLRGCKGIKLPNLDEEMIKGALYDPTYVDVSDLQPEEFAIVWISIYECLLILNDKHQFVDTTGKEAPIHNGAASLAGFAIKHNWTILPKIINLLPNYVTDKYLWRIKVNTYIRVTKRYRRKSI